MTLPPRLVRFSTAACLLACLSIAYGHLQRADPGEEASKAKLPTTGDISLRDTARANDLIRRQPGFFVPNLGQWDHSAKFVHRNDSMTLFLEDRGWVIDLVERPMGPKTKPHAAQHAMSDDRELDQKTRGVALRMTFEGDAHVPEIVGEKKLAGHHNYFLGNDECRWRTGVPLYGSVRYENLYPRIDLQLRHANGVPEYDLLLQPGADLSRVTVHVEGGHGLSIANDGSLVIETPLGSLTQSAPKTWQMGGDGTKCEVICTFVLLGAGRFGFVAAGWHGDTALTIDPGLIWSTFLGGSNGQLANALCVDAGGLVTVAGETHSADFPASSGAYDTSHNSTNSGAADVFVSCLDPSKTGSAQLIYSTFLGGSNGDLARALSVDARGVVTVAGYTGSAKFPTTSGAYGTTIKSLSAFVSRLDPSKIGTAQLVYSTFLAGRDTDYALALSVKPSGVVTVAGYTNSTDFPMTNGAYDTTHNGQADVFVSRLDPSKTGTAQLVYSTFLGGSDRDWANAISVDASGLVTVAGETLSANLPTTRGAFDTTYNGQGSFVSRLDPRKTGRAQLIYSTFLGRGGARALSVDDNGVMTLAGHAGSSNFPTTSGAFQRGAGSSVDAFVSRLDPSKTGTAQLVYSTLLGGRADDQVYALAVDASGVVTVAGSTSSSNFPTTIGAFDQTYNSGPPIWTPWGWIILSDAFVSRLDPRKTGPAQLVYSTFLAGSLIDRAHALAVDASGVVTVAGVTSWLNFPTTSGAYDTSYNGNRTGSPDAFISRLSMGVALYADLHEISVKAGGTQGLAIDAGKAHANKPYRIFGSVTGTSPGLNLLGIHIPLNVDVYTDFTIKNPFAPIYRGFSGVLDASGRATASIVLPANLPPLPPKFHHAFIVYDVTGKFYMASNAVPLRLK